MLRDGGVNIRPYVAVSGVVVARDGAWLEVACLYMWQRMVILYVHIAIVDEFLCV
jgi:hypothetical protein